MRSYSKSDAWYQRALAVTPGASQTGSKAPGRCGPLGGYPLFLKAGDGPHVWDLDGNGYLDFIAGLAAVGLGHADGGVREALEDVLREGSLLSLPTCDEALASEALVAITGWAEQVRWVKTGSEATEAAVRIARRATGREHVLTIASGYNSWHSWFQAVKPQHPGVPHRMTELIHGINYGDHGNVEDLFTCTGRASAAQSVVGGYAAVILEPAPITGGGDAAWLRWLVDLAHAHGTLVIFDEVVWGFRLAAAGGTAYFDVTPDIATYGKAMGNGIPVGAVVGKRDLMQYADVISSTFGGDRLGLAAARAVMAVYRAPWHSPVDTMWHHGRQFQEGVCGVENGFGALAVACTGYPVHPVIRLAAEGVDANLLQSVFVQELAEHGVLWHPAGGNIIANVGDADIGDAVEAVTEALATVERLVNSGRLAEGLRGRRLQPAFARATT
jgi:glutamate-1-semialdehyde 2,1-aminomutase